MAAPRARQTPGRAALFWIMVLGVMGTGIELLLLEHFEGWEQWIPLAVLALALFGVIWFIAASNRSSVRFLSGTMAACVVLGAVGVVLHYRGNVEFELEMEPALRSWPLFKAAMMGATPALAPGAMMQTGLIGMLWGWRHPFVTQTSTDVHTPTGTS